MNTTELFRLEWIAFDVPQISGVSGWTNHPSWDQEQIDWLNGLFPELRFREEMYVDAGEGD